MRVFSRCFEISNYLKCIIVSAGNRYPCSNKKIHDFGNLRSFASHTKTKEALLAVKTCRQILSRTDQANEVNKIFITWLLVRFLF